MEIILQEKNRQSVLIMEFITFYIIMDYEDFVTLVPTNYLLLLQLNHKYQKSNLTS